MGHQTFPLMRVIGVKMWICGLKTAKITVNRRYLSWRYLSNFETVLRISSSLGFFRFSPIFFANSSGKPVGSYSRSYFFELGFQFWATSRKPRKINF